MIFMIWPLTIFLSTYPTAVKLLVAILRLFEAWHWRANMHTQSKEMCIDLYFMVQFISYLWLNNILSEDLMVSNNDHYLISPTVLWVRNEQLAWDVLAGGISHEVALVVLCWPVLQSSGGLTEARGFAFNEDHTHRWGIGAGCCQASLLLLYY